LPMAKRSHRLSHILLALPSYLCRLSSRHWIAFLSFSFPIQRPRENLR
jgi:hypothetical protein